MREFGSMTQDDDNEFLWKKLELFPKDIKLFLIIINILY